MAIAGSGGWVPSNRVRLRNGRIEFLEITQNKPKEILSDLDSAAALLLAGESVTVDVRVEFQGQLWFRVTGVNPFAQVYDPPHPHRSGRRHRLHGATIDSPEHLE